MVILQSCTPAQQQQQQFYHFVPSENPNTIKKVVNESSDSELPSGLEEFILVDAAESDQEEAVLPVNAILPQVFDAHFHLDRLIRAVWGRSGGHSVGDLLLYSLSSEVSYKPVIQVDASSLAKGFAHGPLPLHPWQIELEFVIPADRHLAVYTSLTYKDDITFDQ